MNYNEKLFQDLSPEERFNALQNGCYKQEKDSIKRHFTPEEMVDLKDQLSTQQKNLAENNFIPIIVCCPAK